MIPRMPHGFTHPMRSGSGAFASVYRVQQTALDRRVALKLVYEKNRRVRRELLKEAQTQAKLHATCVPQIFDAFEWHHHVCMVMEWVSGASLASLLRTLLSDDERISLADSFIRALAEIHRLGFVHRDLKPENILLSPENGLYLVDFGFSKNIADAAVSAVATAKGTPAYMAPELWSSGGSIDLIRVDIYAAGKILQQVLDSTAYAGFALSCIEVNPLRRPSSGTELLKIWEQITEYRVNDRLWKKLAGECAAAELSVKLFDAAKELLTSHRGDEAYWLLVESLEENSTNHEAIELLGSFQDHSGIHKNTIRYTIFALVLVAGFGLAFLAGLHSRQQLRGAQSSIRHSNMRRVSSLPQLRNRALVNMAVLRRDSLSSDKISGTIMVRNVPEGGYVVIDTTTVDCDTVIHHGVVVHAGRHEVVIYDQKRTIIKREAVRVLPFEIKTIDAAVYRSSGKEP